ncbi:MAG: LolA family protein [Marmoricola sp.]
MPLFSRRPALRWFVPLVLALLLAGGGTAFGVLTAAAGGGLPTRSAAQLLVDVQNARVAGLSGTVVQTADLGVPSIPGAGGGTSLASLVSGSHTMRVWYAGPNQVRVALQDSLAESDVVRNGKDLWIWSSKDKTASHHALPLSQPDAPDPSAGAQQLTPQQVADQALKAISPTTKVSTQGTAEVAGRSAYELVLSPRDRSTLVDSVHIAIDGETHVPLRVQVFARSMTDPAFSVGFTSFDPSTPDASVFAFNPPPGTKVTESKVTEARAPESGGAAQSSSGQAEPGHQAGAAPAGGTKPTVVGSGWTSVAIAKLPGGVLDAQGTLGQFLGKLPKVNGSWGAGRLLRGTLFSAVLTDDGRLVIGAVPPDTLYQALGR